MIPKIIHFCWFGKKNLPLTAIECIESWKKNCPEFEIKEWNENNYDVFAIPYTKTAYELNKFAFVSDYARFDILQKYGGVYFDVDVEALKDITSLCDRGNWIGMEAVGKVNPGLGMAASPQDPLLNEILSIYEHSPFILKHDTVPWTVVDLTSSVFKENGMYEKNEFQNVRGWSIYPTDFFCPKDVNTGIIKKTHNTYTIHHFDASWIEPWQKETLLFKKKIFQKYGVTFYTILITRFHHILVAIKKLGIKKGISYCILRKKNN